VFDDPNLVSSAGLVPVLALARSAGLPEIAQQHLSVPSDKGANAGLKVLQVHRSPHRTPATNPRSQGRYPGSAGRLLERVVELGQLRTAVMDLVIQSPDELIAAVPHVLGFKSRQDV
jgi:hypothetical protein